MTTGLVSDIQDLIRSTDFAKLRERFISMRPTEIASAILDLEPNEQVVAFRVLPRKLAAEVFEYLHPAAQGVLVKTMGQEDVAALLNHMAPDDRTLLFGELPANVTKHLLSLLTPEERAEAVTLLGYAPGTIGRLMTPHYIAVREDWSVQQVMDFVREHGQDSETLNVIYVVDDTGCLIDDIRMREFLVVPLTKRVSDLMDRRYVALKATDAQEAAVEVFRERRSHGAARHRHGRHPDRHRHGGRRAGRRRAGGDARHAARRRFGGPRRAVHGHRPRTDGEKARRMAGGPVPRRNADGHGDGVLRKEIERAVVLALFVPLIISSGGNSGSQASTLVIRAMALGELRLKDWWRVVRREAVSGVMLGCILGSIGFLRISVWSMFSSIYGPHWLLVATTVGLALVAIVLWGTLVGSMLPLILRRLGFDPATSSAPFVATLVDVTGLVIYFSVGLVVLRGTLL